MSNVLVEGNRDTLILELAKLTKHPLTITKKIKKYSLLYIVCVKCGKEYNYPWFNDIPEKSIKCNCGCWIIKYRNKIKREISERQKVRIEIAQPTPSQE